MVYCTLIFSGLLINVIVNTFPGNYIATKAEYLINVVAKWEYDGLFYIFNYIQ